jgi:hypothetical protein
MGNEVRCVARIAGKRRQGKALLETAELIFRGTECRIRIAFGEMLQVTAADGKLHVRTKGGTSVFEVGQVAEKWREKILHPKTRIEKLGVKAGTRVLLLGNAEPAFMAELRKSGADLRGPGSGDSELVFLFVEDKRGLGSVSDAASRLAGAAGLWIAYPKGKKEITEVEVISAGRKTGLKDVKVVGFSPTHTALKFVIPVDRR